MTLPNLGIEKTPIQNFKSENVKSLKNVKAHSTNKPDQAPPPMHNLEVPSKKVSDKESGKAPDGPVEKRPEVAPKVFSGEGLEQAWDENPKEGLDVASNLLSERDSEDAWHQDSEEAWDETPTQDPQEAPQEQWAGQPAIAWVVGGVGTAFLGGVVTTFFIRSNLNLDNAPDSSDPKKDDLHNRYDSLTNLMWGLGVAGILTAGWAAYEIFSVPPEKTTQSAAQVRVTMLPSRGFAMSIEGRF